MIRTRSQPIAVDKEKRETKPLLLPRSALFSSSSGPSPTSFREKTEGTIVVLGGDVGGVLVAKGLAKLKKFNVVLFDHKVRLHSCNSSTKT